MKLPLEYFFFLLFPLILVLPLPLMASSVALALGLVNVLILVIIRGDWRAVSLQELGENLLLVFGIFIFLIDSFTHLFRDFSFEFIVRDVRISFLLVPLILWLIKDKVRELRIYLLFSLVLGVLLYILYAYGYLVNFYNNVITNRGFEFNHFLIYDLRENVIGAYHHSYIGMYMTFSIAILLYYSREKYRTALIVTALFIFVNQIVIGSKLTLALSFLLILFSVFIQLRTRFKAWLLALASMVVVFVISLIYKSGILNSVSFSTGNRIESWECTIDGFLEKPLFGFGHRNSVTYLENCITSDAVSAHSQYLEEFINYGLFGIWLPILFILLLLKSKKDLLFLVFMTMIVLVSFFENTLSLQRGVLFFVSFASVFLMSQRAKKNKI